MKTITVKCLTDLKAVKLIVKQEFKEHGSRLVTVKKLTESVREAQKGLYWIWCGVIGAEHGNTKLEQHRIFKEKFFLRVYVNDEENHPQYKEIAEHMQAVKLNAPDTHKVLRNFIIDETHIADATKENMMEILTEISALARDFQIRLPAPDRDGLI